jgi:hypothetical protein
VNQIVSSVSGFTTAVFTVECGLKLVAEGYQPLRYFTDPENGNFNKLDFAIVVGSFAFMVRIWTKQHTRSKRSALKEVRDVISRVLEKEHASFEARMYFDDTMVFVLGARALHDDGDIFRWTLRVRARATGR